jgi:hypothetical protein
MTKVVGFFVFKIYITNIIFSKYIVEAHSSASPRKELQQFIKICTHSFNGTDIVYVDALLCASTINVLDIYYMNKTLKLIRRTAVRLYDKYKFGIISITDQSVLIWNRFFTSLNAEPLYL